MIHGEIKIKNTKVGSRFVYTKRIRFCAVHGAIDLFTCGDWEVKHGACNESEKPHGINSAIHQATKKAA